MTVFFYVLFLIFFYFIYIYFVVVLVCCGELVNLGVCVNHHCRFGV